MWWTGEYEAGGAWRPMTKREQPGCGMYDEDWHDEIVAVAPGAKQPLGPWIGAPNLAHDMSAPGRYRVRMHYAYTAGAGEQTEFDPGAMGNAEPFELESNPVEITITPAR